MNTRGGDQHLSHVQNLRRRERERTCSRAMEPLPGKYTRADGSASVNMAFVEASLIYFFDHLVNPHVLQQPKKLLLVLRTSLAHLCQLPSPCTYPGMLPLPLPRASGLALTTPLPFCCWSSMLAGLQAQHNLQAEVT